MSKIFLLHDLNENIVDNMQLDLSDAMQFSAKPLIKNCIGCFECWLKTPGRCVIRDRGEVLPSLLASADRVIIISRLVYGGLSPEIKACMDRSIGYLLPYFQIIDGEMHHTMRYENQFNLEVYFYSQKTAEEEQLLAQNVVKANAINLGAAKSEAHFFESAEDIREALR